MFGFSSQLAIKQCYPWQKAFYLLILQRYCSELPNQLILNLTMVGITLNGHVQSVVSKVLFCQSIWM